MHDTSRQRRGEIGEELAARLLELRGYEILQRNARWADVEVDLVARRRRCLVLVEVKLRTRAVVPATSALGTRQAARLVRAAHALLARHAWAQEIRIDVVAIDWSAADGTLCLQHLPGAVSG